MPPFPPLERSAIFNVANGSPTVRLSHIKFQNSVLVPVVSVSAVTGELTIEECSFAHNLKSAIKVTGGNGSTTRVVVRSSHFVDNGADGIDGGAMLLQGGVISIHNCTFSANFGRNGGALAAIGVGQYAIYHSTFRQNVASRRGGALYGSGSSIVLGNQSWLVQNQAAVSGGSIASHRWCERDVCASSAFRVLDRQPSAMRAVGVW